MARNRNSAKSPKQSLALAYRFTVCARIPEPDYSNSVRDQDQTIKSKSSAASASAVAALSGVSGYVAHPCLRPKCLKCTVTRLWWWSNVNFNGWRRTTSTLEEARHEST
jgi:hypothetical protein